MSRAVAAALKTALQQTHVRPIVLFAVDTLGGWIRTWSGMGNITYDGNVYTGIGDMAAVSEVLEGTELGAQGVVMSLSGIPNDLIAAAITQIQHNRKAFVYFGALNLQTGQLIETYELFSGDTDVVSIVEGPNSSTLKLTVENKMISLQRPRTRRYTPEDQKIDHPDDKGFDFVAGLVDKSIVWGN